MCLTHTQDISSQTINGFWCYGMECKIQHWFGLRAAGAKGCPKILHRICYISFYSHNSMTKGKRRLRVCRREFKQIVDGGMAAYNMKETRKSNPFHRFFNELTPVCLQCVPAQNFSPLVNFTDFQLNNLHYYLSLCWWLRPSFDFSLS